VGYALDEFNAELISEEMQAAVDEARAEQIIAGELMVHDFMSTAPARCRCNDLAPDIPDAGDRSRPFPQNGAALPHAHPTRLPSN
jgi:hypothetical protein